MATKLFNFVIEIDGVDVALIQEVKKPEVEVQAALHGAANYDIKTAGGVVVSDAELKKIKPATNSDNFGWSWLTTAAAGALPEQYKRNVVFREMAPNGTTLNAWLWEGVWCRKLVDDNNFKRGTTTDNVVETITLSVDKVTKLT